MAESDAETATTTEDRANSSDRLMLWLGSERDRLVVELERCEGDLAVAVREATEARGRLDKAQRVVVACRTSKYRGDADWLWLNFRAALAAPVQPEETQQ